uniref:Uncharacterized protein n=1 Tax=Anguilla anguilla TaxID=7936 RepID=A0A0E9ULW5_ANGAN
MDIQTGILHGFIEADTFKQVRNTILKGPET